ncbi:MAG: hypothetical protein ACRED5_04515 [Propylenella sp.]
MALALLGSRKMGAPLSDGTNGSGRPPLRILFTEGASTSARQALTALGPRGYVIDICDPDAHCICRFSSFVHRFHRCPPLSKDPAGYLAFVVKLLKTRQYDILLPIHEQGLVFAKARRWLPPVGLALPSFKAYADALDKVKFSQLLSVLRLAQPRTRIVPDVSAVPGEAELPFVLKHPLGTASRGVWMVNSADDLLRARAEIGAETKPIIVQDMVSGPVEHAQAVFDRGRLVGMHAYRDLKTGVGGGAAVKESVSRPSVRAALIRIGRHLDWHGALSLGYIWSRGEAHYIDCNPRLVEPMSAVLAGMDLPELLVRVSLGESPREAPPGRVPVRTHLALQAMLGVAKQSGSRAAVLRESWQLFSAGGVYSGSREELTPSRVDWLSPVPVALAAVALVAHPGMAEILPRSGWGAGLLTPHAIKAIGEIEA